MSAKEEQIDKVSNNIFMNLFALGKANRFIAESFDVSAQSQMIPFHFLSDLFSANKLLCKNAFFISKIMTYINLSNWERLKKLKKLV